VWRLRSANCYIRVTLLYFTHAVRSPAASSSVNYNLVGGCRLQSTADLLAASNLSSEPRRPPMSQPGSLFTNLSSEPRRPPMSQPFSLFTNLSSEPRRPPMSQPGSLFTNLSSEPRRPPMSQPGSLFTNLSSEPRRPPMSQPGSLFTNFEDVTVSGSRLPRRQQCDEILSTGSRNAAEPAHAQWEYFTLIYNKRLSCCRGTARRSTSLVDVVNSISYDD